MKNKTKYTPKDNQPTILAFCPNPMTLDMSLPWGHGNIQRHDHSGCYIKMVIDQDNQLVVQNLIAKDPNGNPVGWHFHSSTLGLNLYTKDPVWAEQVELETIILPTLDGTMTYNNTDRNGWVVYNSPTDAWFMPDTDFQKRYKVYMEFIGR